MTTMIAEQPWMVAIALGLLGGALIFGWLQTGKKAAALIGLVCLGLVPVAFVVASNWETDREQIERLIRDTAAAIERNDFETVYQLIGDDEAEAMARRELPQFEFTMASVNKIRSIEVIEGTFPPEADVDMSVKVDVSTKRGGVKNIRVVRRLELRLQKENDHWKVTQYRHSPVVGGPDQYTDQFTTK
ncbi:hypothetical protein K227x_47550 [Rubripirellula lacrimiformis]|uniref:Uncharacterized protein n=1 Tax=Rubripirellula lacrimiformis TaxID=1930273 RepID=A0A517NGT3_9BACT|nr:hypothetical protein [Rubripirellula lacrimiformis]QDT06346.1 hypothetical protein K227x_47550 [Rubripirellula lacrimiformis]